MRLIASDLDGTLLRNDKTWSTFTTTVLAAVHEQHRFVAVTGRPPRLIRQLPGVAELGDLVVCTNGSLVINTSSSATIVDERIPAATLSEVIAEIRSSAPSAIFVVETADGQRRPPDPSPRHDDQLIAEGANKLLVFADEDIERLTDIVTLASVSLAEPTRSNDAFVEVGPLGVTKATSLAAIAARWDIDQAHTIAYGDMPNDLAAIAWAGLGVAVGNAHPDLALAADLVLERTNEEDAVAHHLVRELQLEVPPQPAPQ